MSEKLRWKIAYHLDKFKSLCWVDLVLWALDGTRERGLPVPSSTEQCKADAGRCGGCYCGKFRTPDQFSVNDPAVPAWRVVEVDRREPTV